MGIIAFYVSEYGYGHAARSIALIREILRMTDDMQIIVCHSFALPFMKDSLKIYEERVLFHEIETDIGYVLNQHSLLLDWQALEKQYGHYVRELPYIVELEVAFLKEFQVACIISDISPIAFEVGERLAVPSIGISNFTWYTAYQDVVPRDLLDHFFRLYEKMDHFYSLAGSKEQWGKGKSKEFGFYSRQAEPLEVERIRSELNPNRDKQITFVPIGMRIDIGDISNWKLWNNEACRFVVSSNMDVNHPNVVKIPREYTESQNYVAASDIVISKAGWGTVSEAVVHGKKLFIIDRQGMREDQNTIEFLRKHNLCELITWERLQNLTIPIHHSNEARILYVNEVTNIASHILMSV
ncbi:glycosyltransferase [Bacillus sp. OTU530]|uniref:glycosyltransferase n=1 Tax=Bacillus sp. OTU530 TaxID=3043862 RepID=UPI00313AD6BA